MLSNPSKTVTIYIVAGFIEKCFDKAFTKLNTEKGFHVTEVYPLNVNIFCDDESLSSCAIDRTYSKVKEPASSPSSSKDNNEEGKSAGFMKMSPEITRPLSKDGPRETGGREHE